LAAIEEMAFAIRFIPNPDKDIQIAAIRAAIRSMGYIMNPDKDVQLEVVKKNGQAIEYIDNPDSEVQQIAAKNLCISYSFIFKDSLETKFTDPVALLTLYKNQTDTKIKEVIKKSPYWKDDAELVSEYINDILKNFKPND
jgi:hypothetical protein